MKMPVPFLRPCHKSTWPAFVALFLFVCSSQQAYGQSQQELLFFTSVDAFKNTSGTTPNVEDSFVRPAVDVLYSYSGDKFRFLGEYLWSSDESELERLKAGWKISDNTMFWLGRYHSTAKFWTSEYHHGQFLQTSITRPSVDLWEDESGAMPSHVTGFSLEHESISANESAIDYAFSVGLGPRFEGQELVPFDLLDPGSGHEAALNYRMVYRPSVISLNQFGLATAWNEINVISESAPALADLKHIRQVTIGVFADWNWDKWRLLANFIYFDHDMQYVDESKKDEFVAGYVQAEYELSKSWKIFSRVDSAFGEDQSPYLSLLPVFIVHRNMIGARWDFASFQSFTMEIADTSVQGADFSHNSFKEVRAQWSAVFP